MTSAVLTRGTRVAQLPDHSALYGSSVAAPGRTRQDKPDAIVVPATRPASTLDRLIGLAADLGVELVVLASRQTAVDQVFERMRRRHGSRGVVAPVDGFHASARLITSGVEFAAAHGGRHSDLSAKRNLGLRLARLRGWSKIVFVDDDIELRPADVLRIGRQLDRHPVVGMRCEQFPDNSVLCHARRLAKLPQGVFITGAVLGVNCAALPPSFFPQIYNEDWFFFGDAAAGRQLPTPVNAKQARYEPFRDPLRARHEEFGDLLAEGLYSLIQSSGLSSFREVVDVASKGFWESFVVERLNTIDEVQKTLVSLDGDGAWGDEVTQALEALEFARRTYVGSDATVDAAVCRDFLDAWRVDDATWRHNSRRAPWPRPRTDQALAELGVVSALTPSSGRVC